jgi:hypothetical protein
MRKPVSLCPPHSNFLAISRDPHPRFDVVSSR